MDKLDDLKAWLSAQGSVAVAYSGGVDSTFLLAVAFQVLGENACALTVENCLNPKRELCNAADWCVQQGVPHHAVKLEPWGIDGFASNPENRCYLCKKALYSKLLETAQEQHLGVLLDGSNADDLKAYRPGHDAVEEMGVASPLEQFGFTKAEIRECSGEMGLPTWDKPSFSCLASRFPYGEKLTLEKLAMVEQAEELLEQRGFVQYRVRVHGTIARIEVLQEQMPLLVELAPSIAVELRSIGFDYATMDLQGFRSGSMDLHIRED